MGMIALALCALCWLSFYGLGWWYAVRYIRCRWRGARYALRFNQRLLWWMDSALWAALMLSLLAPILASRPIPMPALVAGAFTIIFSGLCLRQVGAYPR